MADHDLGLVEKMSVMLEGESFAFLRRNRTKQQKDLAPLEILLPHNHNERTALLRSRQIIMVVDM